MNQELKTKIDTLFNEYVTSNGYEPQYAQCRVKYLDNGTEFECNINLSADDGGEEDDNAFFYCDSLNDLKSLTKKGCREFIIIGCLGLFKLAD